MSAPSLPPHLNSLAEALCGAAGAFLSTGSLYPLEMLKQQLATAKPGTTVADVVRTVGGLPGLYRGVHYKAVQVVIAKFLYSFYHSVLSDAAKGEKSTALQLTIGYVSDLSVAPITLPIEALITKVQTGASGGILTVFGQTLRNDGVLSLYGGLKWQALVSFMPAIQQTVFDTLKSAALKGGGSLSASRAFLYGAVARVVALIFVFPFMKIKTVVQAGGSARALVTGVRQNGVASLYQGFVPEVVRGVLSAALFFMVKELLAVQSRRLVAKLTERSRQRDDDRRHDSL